MKGLSETRNAKYLQNRLDIKSLLRAKRLNQAYLKQKCCKPIFIEDIFLFSFNQHINQLFVVYNLGVTFNRTLEHTKKCAFSTLGLFTPGF